MSYPSFENKRYVNKVRINKFTQTEIKQFRETHTQIRQRPSVDSGIQTLKTERSEIGIQTMQTDMELVKVLAKGRN